MDKLVTMTAEEADLLYEAARQAFLRWSWPDDAEECKAMKSALSKLRRADVITIEKEE